MGAEENAATSSRSGRTREWGDFDTVLAGAPRLPANNMPTAIFDPEVLYGVPPADPIIEAAPAPATAAQAEPAPPSSMSVQEARDSDIILSVLRHEIDEEDVKDVKIGQETLVMNTTLFSPYQLAEDPSEGHVTAQDAKMLQKIRDHGVDDMNIATVAAFEAQPGETENSDIPPTAAQNVTVAIRKLVVSALEPVSHQKHAAEEKDREDVEHVSPQKRRLEVENDPSKSFNEGSSLSGKSD